MLSVVEVQNHLNNEVVFLWNKVCLDRCIANKKSSHDKKHPNNTHLDDVYISYRTRS